jgi:hypothetical protein
MKRKPSFDALWVKRQLDRPEWGMSALADDPAKSSLVLDRDLDQDKSVNPTGPRIRCPLCGWSPRNDDRWS